MMQSPSAGMCPFFKKPWGVLCNMVFQTAACLVFLLSIVSCDTKPELTIDGGAVFAESYMWCEWATFNQNWSLRAGVLIGNPVNPPTNMPSNIFTKGYPFPSDFKIRWFHFGNQKHYEATLTDQALIDKAFASVQSHNAFKFDKLIYVSIYDSGKVELWFGLIDLSPNGKQYIELLGGTQGYEVEGKTSDYEELTIQAIEEGRVPASVLDKKE